MEYPNSNAVPVSCTQRALHGTACTVRSHPRRRLMTPFIIPHLSLALSLLCWAHRDQKQYAEKWCSFLIPVPVDSSDYTLGGASGVCREVYLYSWLAKSEKRSPAMARSSIKSLKPRARELCTVLVLKEAFQNSATCLRVDLNLSLIHI